MPGVKENLKRGTIEMVLLTMLHSREMYGYEIVQELDKRSKGRFVMREGTLYPTLHRLVAKGYLTDREEQVGRQVRVYYRLTPEGEERLKYIIIEYTSIQIAIQDIFESCRFESGRGDHFV